MLQKLACLRYNPQMRMTFPSFPRVERLSPANGVLTRRWANRVNLASYGEVTVCSSLAACGADTDCEALSRAPTGNSGPRETKARGETNGDRPAIQVEVLARPISDGGDAMRGRC